MSNVRLDSKPASISGTRISVGLGGNNSESMQQKLHDCLPECSEWNADTLGLDAGNSRSFHYSHGAFILYEDGAYIYIYIRT